MNKPKSRELKSEARSLLMGKHHFFAVVTFLVFIAYFLMMYILNNAFPAGGGTLNFVLSLACTALINIVYYLICAGQAALYLQLCRSQEMKLNQLIFAFYHRPEPVAVFAIVQFIVQTIAANLYVLIVSRLWHSATWTELLTMCAAALIITVILIWVELGLGMTLFLYCDNPQKSGFQLLRESWQLVHGNRGRLLYLMLSFAGVMLLGLLSSGIGFLFAHPYINTAQGLFYLNLKETPQ